MSSSTAIRAGLAWIGVSLDESRNRAASSPVSGDTSRCEMLVSDSLEKRQIARHAWGVPA